MNTNELAPIPTNDFFCFGATRDRVPFDFVDSRTATAVAALAVTLAESLVYGEQYASDVVRNAQALGTALDREGFTVVGRARGLTSAHVVIVALGERDGFEAMRALESAGIASSATRLPRSHPKANGLRLGSQAMIRMGMGNASVLEVLEHGTTKISLRVPNDLLGRTRQAACRRGVPYQSLITVLID